MCTGIFAECKNDRHVTRRKEMLESEGTITPLFDDVVVSCVPQAGKVSDAMAPQLIEHGVAAVQLDGPLSDAEFVRFGASLGSVAPETDPAVQPFVSDGVILNLVSKHRKTAEVSLQPFAENALSLHSEGSGRLTADQPRYIVLLCCHPGEAPTASQTVLVSMDAVAAQLTEQERDVLRRTRYAHLPATDTILRLVAGKPAFSFRDFASTRLEWANDSDDSTVVTSALVSLLSAMYAPDARAVQWRAGLLVAIDNRRHFHGRTASSVATVGRPRHLKRLRIR